MAFSHGSPAVQRKYDTILTESDERLRAEDLLRLAAYCEARGELAAATELYAQLREGPEAARARRGLEALTGGGEFGRRFEALSRSFLRQTLDPKMIAPMLAGSLAFQLGRTFALGRLAASGAAWWSRGLGARAAAGAFGFAAELPAFVGLQRALQSSPNGLDHDLRAAALSLGTLKLFAFGGRQALGGLARSPAIHPGLAKGPGPASILIPQVSALMGLMAAHRLETALGWRPATDAAGLFVDSLSTLLSLGIGGRLGGLALGRNFARFQRELDLRAETPGPLGRSRPDSWKQAGFGAPIPALAIGHGRTQAGEPGHLMVGPLQMSLWGRGSSRSGEKSQGLGPYRDQRGYATVEEAAAAAQTLRVKILDKKEDTEARLRHLEDLGEALPFLSEGHATFSEALRDLRRLIRQPEIAWDPPIPRPEETLPFYTADLLLRFRAAELYLRSVEKLPIGHAEIQAALVQLRETLAEPRISTRFKKRGEWRKYHEAVEDRVRRQLLPFYLELLPRLATESAEVREGLQLLNSAPWQEFLARGEAPAPRDSREPGELPTGPRQKTAVAWALLLSASTPFQRQLYPQLTLFMTDHLHFLKRAVLRQEPSAITALARLAAVDSSFHGLWLEIPENAPLREAMMAAESEAREVKKFRDGEAADRVLKQAEKGKGLLSRLLNILIEGISKP